MRAIEFGEPGSARLVEAPEPEPRPGEARVRVRAAAICMTDFEILHRRIQADSPVIPGHEWSGVVDAVGSPADAVWIGRRVTGDNELSCLECRYCRRGQWRRCASFRQIGFDAPGGYAEYLRVPVRNLHPLGDDVSFEQGALLEPLGVAIAVATIGEAKLGCTAAILGAGPIGLNCLATLKASGARRIVCVDRRPARLEAARAWGASVQCASADEAREAVKTLHPHGTDIVVDATGNPDMLRLGMELTRFGGNFVLAGYFGGCSTEIRPDTFALRNVRVLGACNNAGFTEAAALAANDGLLRTEGMITHRFGLEDYETVFSGRAIAEPSFVKGVFVP